MTSAHRILVVEDSDDDADLLLRELKRGGIDAVFTRVATPAGAAEAMRAQSFDIVLSDYNLQGYTFSDIGKVVREFDPNIPIIIVSGSIGEENAVSLLKDGVADFVFKGNLKRLLPAIQRELQAAAQQVARRESDQRFRDIVEVSGDWVWETDEEHRFTFFSNRFEDAEWTDPATSLGKTPWEVAGADPGQDEHWQGHISDREAHQTFRNFLFSCTAPSGARYHISMSGVPVFDKTGAFRGYRGTATDETPMVAAFWRAEEAESLLRDAVDSISEGFLILDPEERIVVANEAFRHLFPDVAELSVPGIYYEDFLRAAADRGAFPEARGREGEWVRSRLAEGRGVSDSVVERLNDGRWLLVSERRMSNGGIAGLRMDITALKEAEAQRDHLAEHDGITGLPSKAIFATCLAKEMQRIELQGGCVAVVCLELASLTDIRDTFGLDAGDAAIRELAHRLEAAVGPGETVSHIGGGQFLTLRIGLADDTAALRSVEKLLPAVAAEFRIDGSVVPFRIAVGVSTAPGDATEPDAVIRNATTAMHRAKEKPAQRYQCYNPAMTDAAIVRSTTEGELRQAIDNDELFLVYQPQVTTHGYKLVGLEALVRWQHPTRGLIPPCDFIPIAEKTGLIVPMGEHILKLACAQAAAWSLPASRIPISINISAVQLGEEDELGRRVMEAIAAAGLPPGTITLELTESAILHDVGAATRTMRQLAAHGIRFALDDFGMEHSALSHLSDLPFDILKIDRAFVTRMTEDRGHAALFQAIISMTHSLGMTAVAEGVEHLSQLIYLQAYGCDIAQGYLFSKPLTADAFGALLKQRIVAPALDGESDPFALAPALAAHATAA